MKKIYLVTNLIFGMNVFGQNANVALSNLSSNNGYSSYNSSTKQITGIFFLVLSDGNNSSNIIDPFETSLYLLECDANGAATGSNPIMIKTYTISGMNQMGTVNYTNESVDLSQVSNLNDGMYRMGAWVNSNVGVPQPPDVANDNAALLRSSVGTAPGSVINYSNSGSTGIQKQSSDKSGISVYPNPVSEVATFSNVRSGTITISDVSGRAIESKMISGEKAELNMSKYNAGIYFYQVKQSDTVISGKLIKE